MKQLPAGQGRDRIRLWDKQYQLIWDSTTDTTPAYQHINTWVNATIHYADGSQWHGQFYRCPEGIKRWSPDDIRVFQWPENPFLNLLP